ncbi:hypothetical protein AB1Y20_017945 [Prymnesium parvum]|uniref:C2 domain-containing protein n=1 Tax=Prymnesium parvum TaxID=97485 RepID=A0AB34JQF9_PRYPA
MVLATPRVRPPIPGTALPRHTRGSIAKPLKCGCETAWLLLRYWYAFQLLQPARLPRMSMADALKTLGSQHLNLSDDSVAQLLAGVAGSAELRYDLPLLRAGQAAAPLDEELDHQPCNLRVRVLEASGLPPRPDGSPCRPVVIVTVAEFTRRRTRRCSAKGVGPAVEWNECFDFEGASACSQVVVDVWDQADDGKKTDLLGKAVMSLTDCREGVPHTYFKHLIEGTLAVRLLFSFAELEDPHLEEEEILDSLAMYQ